MVDELTNHEEALKKYSLSDKGKEARKRYSKSDKGKAAKLKYLNSNRFKAAQLRYKLSKTGKQTYKRRLGVRNLLVECEKFLKDNPGKTPEDFLKEIVQ